MSESPLVAFYAGRASDYAGRHLDDIWRMSNDDLEFTHDYIQWLFPLRERSSVQPDVPVVDDQVVEAFRAPELQDRLLESARVMASFYGLRIVASDGKVEVHRAPDFDERRRVWLNRGNHNFLRLTRIMKSLTLLGRPAIAKAWLDALVSIYEDFGSSISADTLRYWRSAVPTSATAQS
jgi:hypothetical protein